nr:hypothetical protein [uncultured Rhodopila sp.]
MEVEFCLEAVEEALETLDEPTTLVVADESIRKQAKQAIRPGTS